MNKKYVKAVIEWIRKEHGGRSKVPPVGTRYCPIINILNETEEGFSWSADITIEQYVTQYSCYVSLKYLSEQAPYNKLKNGEEFELYEGERLVAKGKIISDLVI